MRASLIIILCSGLLAYNAQAQSPPNVRLDITLSENGRRVSPIVKDSDREFFKHVLVVEDGFYGTVYLGRRAKGFSWFKGYLVDNEYISRDFASGVSRINASLKVVPRIVSGSVELTVTPVLSCAAKAAEHNIEIKGLRRVLAAEKGKQVSLNAKSLEKEFFVMFFATDDGKSINVTIVPSELEYGETIE